MCTDCFFYLTSSLVYYSVGVFNSFNAIGMFIALTRPKTNILDLIFQRIPSPTFLYDGFMFELVNREPNSDIFFYDIYERDIPNIRLRFVFFGVDTTHDCGPESSLDLVQFCWDYAERFNSIKYAVVLLPKFYYSLPFGYCLPRLICVRYSGPSPTGGGTR